jgi:GxxExxY protein
VLNTLGAGFLEKVYENALALEPRKAGLAVAQQRDVQVMCDGSVVGEYSTDLLVESRALEFSSTFRRPIAFARSLQATAP